MVGVASSHEKKSFSDPLTTSRLEAAPTEMKGTDCFIVAVHLLACVTSFENNLSDLLNGHPAMRDVQPKIYFTNMLANQVIVEGQTTTMIKPTSMSRQKGNAPQ